MAPVSHPYDAPRRAGEAITALVAATTVLYPGALAALNATGHALPAADAAGLIVQGRVREYVDNATGAAGDKEVVIERGVFAYDNSAGDPVTASMVGKPCYIEDDTIVTSDDGDHARVAGEVVGLEGNKVWVDTAKAPTLQRLIDLEIEVASA